MLGDFFQTIGVAGVIHLGEDHGQQVYRSFDGCGYNRTFRREEVPVQGVGTAPKGSIRTRIGVAGQS
jgi:hypothetical protein